MRYLGNKQRLLTFIDDVIEKYDIQGETFTDLFSGTCSVGDYFKNKFKIIANDYMYFSSVIAHAKLRNSGVPSFEKFEAKMGLNPFDYFNNREYNLDKSFFITENYSPLGDRQFFSQENAIIIDGIRLEIEEQYKLGVVDEKEYYFLIASLLSSSLKVSNTTGTYQAYLKHWDSRATKKIILEPIELDASELHSENIIYCENANALARKISGDIVYIDPPYTINQYANSYHVLETIARYDYPEIFGKTGRRKQRELSHYSNKSRALKEFEDLFRQLNFNHILVSYSNQSIVPIEEMIKLAEKFAIGNKVIVEEISYREYATNNLSHKTTNEGLKEYLLYFKKDYEIKKSALNYSGSKDKVLLEIQKYLPKHIDTFVDAMGGAFNVGLNVVAMNKVIYNEINPYIYGLISTLLEKEKKEIVDEIDGIVSKFNLKKEGKKEYLALREAYNKSGDIMELYTLHLYSFQNIIRFNNNHKMNTPVGNNEFANGNKSRILGFIPKSKKIILMNSNYLDLELELYNEDTVFYFDPPYFITKAEYNDGKRGFEGWSSIHETQLLEFLNEIDSKGMKFMLSNVIKHNGKVHNILLKWIESHGYNMRVIGETGIKYPRIEVIVFNYDLEEAYI